MHKHRVIIITGMIIITILLSFGVIFSYQATIRRQPNIVLPGGITYLGPSPTLIPTPTLRSESSEGKFTAPIDLTNWLIWKGSKYPFTFRYPPTLPIAGIAKDTGDAVGLGWKNLAPEENILFRVVKSGTKIPANAMRIKIPERSDIVAQFTNPILDETVFKKIVESFMWKQE